MNHQRYYCKPIVKMANTSVLVEIEYPNKNFDFKVFKGYGAKQHALNFCNGIKQGFRNVIKANITSTQIIFDFSLN